jgi:biotin operon repressor
MKGGIMLKTLDYHEQPIESFPEIVITTEDLIEAYGRQGEIRRFCHECVEWKTCKGTKWSTCPHRKYYIKEEVKGKYQPKVIRRAANWTAQEDKMLIDLYNKGTDTQYIADQLGKNKRTITQRAAFLRQNGVEVVFKKHRIDWTDKLPQAIKLRKGGMSYKDICKTIGVGLGGLQHQLNKLRRKGLIKNVDGRRR